MDEPTPAEDSMLVFLKFVTPLRGDLLTEMCNPLQKTDHFVTIGISTTSFGFLTVQSPPVKSGIVCGMPPAATDAAESAVTLIHAAAS